MLFATVSKTSKNAMQSCVKNVGSYIVKFNNQNQNQDVCDNNTGYVKTFDTNKQISLLFPSLELALSYLNSRNIAYKIVENSLYTKVKKSYSSNFTKDPNLEY